MSYDYAIILKNESEHPPIVYDCTNPNQNNFADRPEFDWNSEGEDIGEQQLNAELNKESLFHPNYEHDGLPSIEEVSKDLVFSETSLLKKDVSSEEPVVILQQTPESTQENSYQTREDTSDSEEESIHSSNSSPDSSSNLSTLIVNTYSNLRERQDQIDSGKYK
jgi:hypothetical protein